VAAYCADASSGAECLLIACCLLLPMLFPFGCLSPWAFSRCSRAAHKLCWAFRECGISSLPLARPLSLSFCLCFSYSLPLVLLSPASLHPFSLSFRLLSLLQLCVSLNLCRRQATVLAINAPVLAINAAALSAAVVGSQTYNRLQLLEIPRFTIDDLFLQFGARAVSQISALK